MGSVKEYTVGEVITSKKGKLARVVEVHADHIVIEQEDGSQRKLPLRPEETPEERRRRENVEAGRHPLWVSLEDAPRNAATVNRLA